MSAEDKTPLTAEEEAQWRSWLAAGHLPFGDDATQARRIARLFATLDAARRQLADCDEALTLAERAYDRDVPEPPAPAWSLGYRDGRQDVLAVAEASVREMHDYRPVSDDALSAGVTTCGFRDCPQTEEAHVSFRGVLAVIARLREAGEPRRDKAVHVFEASKDGNWDRATTDRVIAHVRADEHRR